MNLETRIEALEDAARPQKKEPFLVVWACNNETVEEAERREGVTRDDYDFPLFVLYDDQELTEDGKTQD